MTRFLLSAVFLFSQAVFAQDFISIEQIRNFHQVNESLSRGGRPTLDEVRALKQMGFKTIINLENTDKYVLPEKQVAESVGLQYFSVPMSALKGPNDNEADFILSQMTDPKNFPVFIHCHHGEDRTGLMVGLYRVLVEKWNPKDAYQEMKDLGFHPFFLKMKHFYKKRTCMNDDDHDDEVEN